MSTTNHNHHHPSIFTIWSENLLQRSIRKALKFMINFFSNNHSNVNNYLNKNFDEFFLLFDLLLQWSYLYRYQSSFTEYFYSLKRTRKDLLKSLIQISIIPYLLEKLQKYYDDKINNDEYDKILLKYYPLMKNFSKSIQIILWLLYVSNNNGNNYPHCPSFLLLWPSKLIIRKINDNDNNDASNIYLYKLSYVLSNFFKITFNTIAFSIQFLDYYNNNQRRLDFQNNNQSKLSPPSIQKSIKSDKFKENQCPICGEQRKNPTALISSGYLFCYQCIYQYLLDNHHCPITGIPSEIEQLIKIFS